MIALPPRMSRDHIVKSYKWNAILDKMNCLSKLTGGKGIEIANRVIHHDDNMFWGKIQSAGPDGEADYSDERYWVKQQYCSNASGDNTAAVSFSDKTNGRWVTATNICEMADGSHDIDADTIVPVFAIKDIQTSRVTRYVFSVSSTYVMADNASVWMIDSNFNLKWRADTGDNTTGIVVDSNKNSYVTGIRNNNKSIWKFDKHGNEIWNYDTGADTWGIDTDDTYIYIAGDDTSNNNVWKVEPSGSPELKWSFDIDPFFINPRANSVKLNGTDLYITGGKRNSDNAVIIRVDASTGIEDWSWGTGSQVVGYGITTDGTYVYQSGDVNLWTDKFVQKVEPGASPELIWDSIAGSSGRFGWRIDIDSSGNVYPAIYADAASSIKKLQASDGSELWSYHTGSYGFGVQVISSTQIILTGVRTSNKSVWELNPSGSNPINSYDTGSNARESDTDVDGNIYIAGNRVSY